MDSMKEQEKPLSSSLIHLTTHPVNSKSQPNDAIRYDQGKLRLELLPLSALEDIALVLQTATKKYPENNWQKGMLWSRCIGSTMRHLFSWIRGIDTDPETGISHLAHAACNILFLIEYQKHNLGIDDRSTL